MRGHIRRLEALSEAEIVGSWAGGGERVDRARSSIRGSRECRYRQPRRDAGVGEADAVEISTPHTLHAQQILDSPTRLPRL